MLTGRRKTRFERGTEETGLAESSVYECCLVEGRHDVNVALRRPAWQRVLFMNVDW